MCWCWFCWSKIPFARFFSCPRLLDTNEVETVVIASFNLVARLHVHQCRQCKCRMRHFCVRSAAQFLIFDRLFFRFSPLSIVSQVKTKTLSDKHALTSAKRKSIASMGDVEKSNNENGAIDKDVENCGRGKNRCEKSIRECVKKKFEKCARDSRRARNFARALRSRTEIREIESTIWIVIYIFLAKLSCMGKSKMANRTDAHRAEFDAPGDNVLCDKVLIAKFNVIQWATQFNWKLKRPLRHS